MNIHRADRGILFILILMINCVECGEQKSVHPVIAFIRTGVWSIYKGPEIVVYDDGMVLLQKNTRHWPIEYSSFTLKKHEMDVLLTSLRLFDTERVKDTLYNLIDAYDLDEQWLVVSLPYKVAIGIYGDIPAYDSSENRVSIPKNILHLFHSILALKGRQSTQWSAEVFEVSVYSRTGKSEGEPVIEWPRDWPHLNDPRVMKLEISAIDSFYKVYRPILYRRCILKLVKRSR